jgi:hypothetical protein
MLVAEEAVLGEPVSVGRFPCYTEKYREFPLIEPQKRYGGPFSAP